MEELLKKLSTYFYQQIDKGVYLQINTFINLF